MKAYRFVLASGQTAAPKTTAAPTVTAQPAPKDRDTEYRATEGGGDVQSGGVLLIEAYAVVWILVFVMVVRSMRKQSTLDHRIEQLRADIAKARGGAASTPSPEDDSSDDDSEAGGDA